MMLPRCRLVLGAMLLKRALRPFHARPWSGVREGAKYNGPLCHGRPSFHDLPVQSKHPGAVVALFVACVQVAPSCLSTLPVGRGVGLRYQGEAGLSGRGVVALFTFVRISSIRPMNHILRSCLLVALAVLPFANEVMATGVGGQPPCWPPPCIPIDGGLSLLVAAGALLGGKKMLDLRRNHKQSV